MRRRILMISDATLEGGTNTYIYDLLCIVTKYSDFTISLLLDNNKNMLCLSNKCRKIGVRVYTEDIYHGNNPESNIQQALNRVIDAVNPDLVHVFCGSIRSCITIREIIIKKNLPLFSTETYLSKTYPITENELARVKEIYEHTKCVTTVCKSNIRILKECYGINTQNVRYIPTSIDTDRYLFSERIIKDEIRVVIIARFVKQKGIDIFIEAFYQLDKNLKKKCKVSIYGDGEEREYLLNLIHSYELEPYIALLGWGVDIVNKLAEYNLCIIPSRDEGLPYVALELLSIGLPCIAADVGGIFELADNGKYMELFEAESIESLKQKLINVITNPQKILQKTEKVKDHIKKNYNQTINYKQFLELWKIY